MASSNSPTNNRVYMLGGILLLWCGAIGLRLVQLQVFDYGDWLHRAQRQQQRTIEVAPRRGVIYDRNGNELAMSINVDSVFAVPSEIPDPQTTANLLGRVLGMDPREVLSRLQSSKTFAWVKRKIDAEASQRVHELNLRGIYFQKESKRFYPKRELAAQVLGWVGMDDEGLGGIEYAYDNRLNGKPGQMYITMDARQKWFGRVERQPDPGDNVVLTIDEKIQYIAERELETAMEETQAKTGTVIVQNPRTGEILALANRPTFNPNNFRDVPRLALKDHAVSDVYEPGSTFKVVTISGALEDKLTTPNELIDCQNGSIVVNGLRIRDHTPLGLLPVTMVLAHSSDVGAIKLGLRLGDRRLDHYIQDFGFGSLTGIELPGESRGIKRPVERWSKVSIGALSMGQEIGVTPLQLVSMISSIANDGVWTAPRIVAGFTEPSGKPQTVVFHPGDRHRAISTLTAAEMRHMLESVVLFGTGKKAILDGYTSAGKTGTAQKIDPATGAYSHTDYVGSFAGFAPVNNPAVTILVVLDSAKGLHQGGQIAAPVFRRIAQQVLAYLNVPHDVEVKDTKREQLRADSRNSDLEDDAPDRLGDEPDWPREQATSETVASSDSKSQSPTLIANAGNTGATASDSQSQSTGVNSTQLNGTVVLDVQSGGAVVPSLVGKPLRLVVEAAQQAGVELDASGDGIAREQWPVAGTHIAPGSTVRVRLGP